MLRFDDELNKKSRMFQNLLRISIEISKILEGVL